MLECILNLIIHINNRKKKVLTACFISVPENKVEELGDCYFLAAEALTPPELFVHLLL